MKFVQKAQWKMCGEKDAHFFFGGGGVLETSAIFWWQEIVPLPPTTPTTVSTSFDPAFKKCGLLPRLVAIHGFSLSLSPPSNQLFKWTSSQAAYAHC